MREVNEPIVNSLSIVGRIFPLTNNEGPVVPKTLVSVDNFKSPK